MFDGEKNSGYNKSEIFKGCMFMKEFNIKGMSCAACSARVEKAVSELKDVDECSVNLLTNSMLVNGSASTEEIIAAVEKAGYEAFSKENTNSKAQKEKGMEQETKALLTRLCLSFAILLPLMYLSMGHIMWGFPLPDFLNSSALLQGILQFVLTLLVMVINKKFFISGFKGIIYRTPNMDSLVAIGAGASFVYSAIVFVLGDSQHHIVHNLYFESAAMILTLITLGKLLEAFSKGKTTNAIKGLLQLSPKTAIVIRDGKEIAIAADELKKGDIFIVKSGGNIAADAVIIEGECSIDESALTGESLPVDKKSGDRVWAATTNRFGYIKCRAQRVGSETTLSQIIKLVESASASKAPIAKIADKVSGVFVPSVLVIAAVTAIVWLVSGAQVGFALARGVSVLVISCPCALGLATPVAIMVASGVGAKNSVLFKTASSLEMAGKTTVALLDKTGTITQGKPDVTDIIAADDTEQSLLLSAAYSLENKSEHPLASAIVRYAEQNAVPLKEVEKLEIVSGKGLSAEFEGQSLLGGNAEFVSDISEELLSVGEKLSNEGKTPLYFSLNGKTLGIIAVADKIKEDSSDAIKSLKGLGIYTVMLTGDNKTTAEAVGKQVNVDEVIANVLPHQKAEVVERFKKQGKVLMVGDGINDAPALTSADTSIAIGAGVDIAIDCADIVLMKSNLKDVVTAIRLSRQTLKNIKENLFWAFIYNVIGIPLAAGVWIPIFGWELNPMFAAAAMSLSSVCVVTNSLRLNLFKTEQKTSKKETGKMKKTITIEGMMCPHCEARVKTAFEALAEVACAEVSHQSKTAVLTLSAELSDQKIKETVEQNGYKFVSAE